MGLEKYQQKRDFSRTPEPKGKTPPNAEGNSYLIHKHAARRLHYDLRLELDGVLLSWAIPKGPSLDPKERRLAVHVEDHPLEYGDFEGNIPKGEYGAGTVLLWDRGTWEPIGDPRDGLRKGDLKFRLHGEKLRGSWVLVRMGKAAAGADEKQNWLLIKHSDEEAVPLQERDVLEELPDSVATGRSMQEIAEARDRQWTSEGETPEPPDLKTLSGARRSPFPERVRPQLATLVEKPPEGDEWLHEVKFDGYRALCRIEDGKARFYTRQGNDWTDRFASLVAAVEALTVQNALLDGEVAVLLQNGASSFQALQNSLTTKGKDLVYYVFDLLYLNGYDIRRTPLLERKALLASLLREEAGPVRFSDHFQGNGKELFETACKHSLEGIISKQANRPYTSGRSADWLKIKCVKSQEFIVGGFTDPGGSRIGFGALLVGFRENGKLVYAGKVGTGYTERTLKDLLPRLEKLQQPESPFVNPPKGSAVRKVHWVKPELVAQVEFSEWTRDGILRSPSFQGLREDKKPAEVGRENVADAAQSQQDRLDVAGVRISNPDKILYPGQGITKLQLAQYYEAVLDWALPHIKNRPLMFLRCPEGFHKQCFFQKHAADSVAEAVKKVNIPEDDGEATGLYVDSAKGLISLAQMGVLEIHAWGCRISRIERPDLMIFDLDPDSGVAWERVVEAAHEIRAFLKELGFVSFVKTTGGKGLHLQVPLSGNSNWDEVKGFSKSIADALVSAAPDRYTAVMSKAKRKGKVFIDYLRNGRGSTAICPYSTRARVGAPVATPVDWDELTPDLRPDLFTIETLPSRFAALRRDPWEGIYKFKQSITAEGRRMLEG